MKDLRIIASGILKRPQKVVVKSYSDRKGVTDHKTMGKYSAKNGQCGYQCLGVLQRPVTFSIKVCFLPEVRNISVLITHTPCIHSSVILVPYFWNGYSCHNILLICFNHIMIYLLFDWSGKPMVCIQNVHHKTSTARHKIHKSGDGC